MIRDAQEVISALQHGLAARLGAERFELWFGRQVRFQILRERLVLLASHQFILERIRKQFRSEIIATLQQREYVELESKRFHPTDVGRLVNGFVTEHFSDYVDYDFTARLEDDLDAVSRGEREWVPLLKDFWKPFSKARAVDFLAFLELARRGRAIPPFRVPEGVSRREAERTYQKEQLERSIRYCRESLGISA